LSPCNCFFFCLFSINLVNSALADLDSLGGSFVHGLHVFDHLNAAHSGDDSAKHDVFTVEEGEGSASRDVELGLVSVFQIVSLAHAEESNFSVLHVEGLVRELSVVERCEGVRVLSLDFTHLDEHALDDAVNLRLSVTDKFAFLVLELTA
jgi:hypothetical protein